MMPQLGKHVIKYIFLLALIAASIALEYKAESATFVNIASFCAALAAFLMADIVALTRRTKGVPEAENAKAVLTRISSYTISDHDLRGQVRVLFVDDDDLRMVDKIRDKGYSAHHKQRVATLSDIPPDQYHIVYMDITGIGTEHFPDEGADILKDLKKRSPIPLRVVYSSVSLTPGTPRARKVYENTESQLSKDVSLEEHTESILESARLYFSLDNLIAALAYRRSTSASALKSDLEEMSSEVDLRKAIWRHTSTEGPEDLAIRHLYQTLESLSRVAND